MATLPNYLKPLSTLLPELVKTPEIPKLQFPSVCLYCGEDLEHLECVNGYDERVFISMEDGEHGPFCSEGCAERFGLNYDDREGLDPLSVYKGAAE